MALGVFGESREQQGRVRNCGCFVDLVETLA